MKTSPKKATTFQLNNNLYGNYQSQEELDAVYNVEKAVPQFLDYIADFQRSSVQARQQLTERQVQAFGPTKSEHLIIYPSARPHAPVLLFIHGGYWRMGSAADHDFIATGPLSNGYTVVIVNYELCPKVAIPEIVRQVRAAVCWTAKNIMNYSGDPDKIYLAGHSAGAHLAAMMLHTDWSDYDLPQETLKGALLISGLYELAPVAQCFIQPALRITAEQVLSCSPISLIQQCSIPLIIAWGAQETLAFREHSAQYAQSWAEQGNTGESLVMEDQDHFSILLGFKNPQSRIIQALDKLQQINTKQ